MYNMSKKKKIFNLQAKKEGSRENAMKCKYFKNLSSQNFSLLILEYLFLHAMYVTAQHTISRVSG